MRDSNPEVEGGGAEALAAAGVKVDWAEDPTPFERQNEGWLTLVRLGRPFVRVKVALTLDGRTALTMRRRSQITGAGGREVTMRLRAESTAVVVGASTVAVDNPQLTVREPDDSVSERTPRRFVLSRTSIPDARSVLFNDGYGQTTLVTSDTAPGPLLAALEQRGARALVYPYREGLRAALAALASDGVSDVLVEAGPALFSALWKERLIDEMVLITAGGMSGNAAPPLFLGTADAEGADLAPAFRPVETGIAGGDAVTVWRPLS
jgi:diaminohydroxyphosphoribosylaminopyrimidine deaminase/5-amino-6-(5-phosphoribosylamino)uracil reductase